MPLSSVFTKIKNPLSKNKKLYSAVLLAFIGMGTLGLAYYLFIQNKEQHLKTYRFQLLDSHYEKISRHFDHIVAKECAYSGTTKAATEKEKEKDKEKDKDKAENKDKDKTSNQEKPKDSCKIIRSKICNTLNREKLEEIIHSSNIYEEFDEVFISFKKIESKEKEKENEKKDFSTLSKTSDYLHLKKVYGKDTVNGIEYLNFPGKYIYKT